LQSSVHGVLSKSHVPRAWRFNNRGNPMNIIQKQADFGRTLFEINQNALQETIRTQQENIRKYFELNATFGQRLPEVRDVTSFMELQREYGATLWNGIKESTQSQAGILKSAVEETGTAVRKVFTPEAA
jgi:hypothetical protein